MDFSVDAELEAELILRVFVAAVLGGGIGLQRGLARKPDGIRLALLDCGGGVVLIRLYCSFIKLGLARTFYPL